MCVCACVRAYMRVWGGGAHGDMPFVGMFETIIFTRVFLLSCSHMSMYCLWMSSFTFLVSSKLKVEILYCKFVCHSVISCDVCVCACVCVRACVCVHVCMCVCC